MGTTTTWWLVLVLGTQAACASSRGAGSSTELAGTPSSTGCDAWFAIGGKFSQMNDVRYTLKNRSRNPVCLASRVVVVFEARLSPGLVHASAPVGWTTTYVPCQTSGGVCGVEWRTRHGYDSTRTPRQKLWIVEVGRRRVQMSIGTVGG
jgi:hypothetical protein